MTLSKYHHDMKRLLKQASALLGAPVRVFTLAWSVDQQLRKRLVRERQVGLGTLPPFLIWLQGCPGHELTFGFQLYRLTAVRRTIQLLSYTSQRRSVYWYVREEDLTTLYRVVRSLLRDGREEVLPPLLDRDLRQRLWDNTIGFLVNGTEELKRYEVPQKRGVLLLGKPGNGKTMACRWLRAEAERRGLEWQTVTVQEYERAESEGDVDWLFELDRPGIVLFDDFDAPLRTREDTSVRQQATFLAQLDGINARSGVGYLFTSNLTVDAIDSAIRRPGRIDTILSFAAPDAQLRRRLIRERWHVDIVEHVPVEMLVAETADCSFAELEELRKLLVLRYVETREWDADWALATLRARLAHSDDRKPIGFGARVPTGNLTADVLTPVAKHLSR